MAAIATEAPGKVARRFDSSGATRASFHVRMLGGGAELHRLRWFDCALVFVFGLTLLGMNLGGARALTYHEVTFAAPAKEMLRDGHWIVPTIAGVPFTDKPPLTAWLIAGSLALFQTDAEWAARLPSVVSAVLTALMLAAFVTRWWGRRIGVLAGLVQLTTFATLMQARLAESDIHLCTTVCGAMLAFAWANVESPAGRSSGRWWPWLFFAAFGLSFLVKALIGPVFILGACGMYLLWSQDLRGFKFFLSPVGWMICGLLIVPWFVLAVREYPPLLDNLLLHHFGRFQGRMGAHEPWYAYLYLIPMLLLPWTPWTGFAVFRGLRGGAFMLPVYRLLVCWIVPGLTLLSISAFKAKHYTIPLLPPLVALTAVGFWQYLAMRRTAARLHSVWLWSATGLGVLAAVATLYVAQPHGQYGVMFAVALAGAGLAGMIEAERRRRIDLVRGLAFATIWCVMAVVAWGVLPAHDSYRALAQLAARINARGAEIERLYMVRLPDNAMTYYLDPPIARYDQEADFTRQLPNDPGPLYIVAPVKSREALAAQGRLETLDESPDVGKNAAGANRPMLFRLTRGGEERVAARPAGAD